MKSLLSLTQELNAGLTKSRDLVEKSLSKIKDPKGEGKRVILKLHEKDARKTADTIDKRRSKIGSASPLEGLVVSVKDLFDVAGDVTTAGSLLLRNRPPAQQDAELVGRLRNAGAIVIGRTNMTEFAFSGLGLNPHYGTPKNPWDRKIGRIPGGSSAGAAVSVTDGMANFALGSDTGGSVRIPASLCGLTGFKPTTKRMSAKGIYPLVQSLDAGGPLAPTVNCCAIIDAVLAGEEIVLPDSTSINGLKLAIPQTLVLDDLDLHTAKTFEKTLTKLDNAGAIISEIKFKELGKIPEINSKGEIYAEAFAFHRKQIAENGDQYDPRVKSRILRFKNLSAADYIDALDARQNLIKKANAITKPFNAIILPTTAIVAPPIKALEKSEELYLTKNKTILRNTFCFNFLDRCALSIPMQNKGDPPVGIMVVGETMGDRNLFIVGRSIEKTLHNQC